MVFFVFFILIAGALALWLAFWVVLFVIGLFAIAHEEIAYRRAEKHHPGIYARHKRILAIRDAKRKEKEAYEKWRKKMMWEIYKDSCRRRDHEYAGAYAAGLGS